MITSSGLLFKYYPGGVTDPDQVIGLRTDGEPLVWHLELTQEQKERIAPLVGTGKVVSVTGEEDKSQHWYVRHLKVDSWTVAGDLADHLHKTHEGKG